MSFTPVRSVWEYQNDITSKRNQSTDKLIWKLFLVGLLIAFLVPLIASAVIITLWLSELTIVSFTGGTSGTASITTTNSTATTATTTTTTTTTSITSTTSATTICSTTAITTTVTSGPLPSECLSYTIITDSTRQASYGSGSACDNTIFSSSQWVRFSGSAGTMLANCPVAGYRCGTLASGWYSGVYPPAAGATTSGNVCYNFLGNTCNWSNSISITNCNGYYVFYLSAPTQCSLRYCTI